MKVNPNGNLDLVKADGKLRAWRKRYNTPAKVAAAHRKVLLERVSQSMAFENQPVSTDRLKTLTATPKAKAS
ncbi:MAG: hypothetical protein NTZ28_02320 [Nitrospirae bacterium]|nr:hypothetical protein [Nitrospirota bacterium]